MGRDRKWWTNDFHFVETIYQYKWTPNNNNNDKKNKTTKLNENGKKCSNRKHWKAEPRNKTKTTTIIKIKMRTPNGLHLVVHTKSKWQVLICTACDAILISIQLRITIEQYQNLFVFIILIIFFSLGLSLSIWRTENVRWTWQANNKCWWWQGNVMRMHCILPTFSTFRWMNRQDLCVL